MADDTRQEEVRKALNQNPNGAPSFSGDQWKDAAPAYKPPENANLMAGGTQHTAGGKVSDISVVDAAKTIKLEDFTQLPKKPCVKDSLMAGIGAGFAVGGIRAIWRAPIMIACNWAVGSFCFSSFFMYQYCMYQRQAEKEGMKRAMEIIDRKSIERKQKEARLERARDVRRQKKEEEDQQKFAKLRDEHEKKRSWWQVW